MEHNLEEFAKIVDDFLDALNNRDQANGNKITNDCKKKLKKFIEEDGRAAALGVTHRLELIRKIAASSLRKREEQANEAIEEMLSEITSE